MNNDWKERLGTVYSTNPDFKYTTPDNNDATPALPPAKQKLRVALDKRNRKGKMVTIVADYIGPEDDLKELGRLLKTKCGVGGSVKEGEIIIQGDFRDRVVAVLTELGYSARRL